MPNDIAKAVLLYPFNVSHYCREEMCTRVDQIVYPNNPLYGYIEHHSCHTSCNERISHGSNYNLHFCYFVNYCDKQIQVLSPK